MLVSSLKRNIEIIRCKVCVDTEQVDDCLYAYYLVYGKDIEKKYYTDSQYSCFNMEIKDGYYRCIFFYKINNIINSVSESFRIISGKIVGNNEACAWSNSVLKVRGLDRWKKALYEYRYLYEFFDKDSIENGIHSISYNDIPIDLNVELKNNKSLFIFFNGATPRTRDMKLPIFSGLGVIPENANIVCINDPTLYINDSLRLGWYAGSKFQNLQKVLLQVITHLISISKCSRAVFVGGSGGGFASLYYSRNIANSIAIVWNPQTNILKYVPKFVKEYSSCAFNSDLFDHESKDLELHINTDLLKEYRKGHNNHIFYMQNQSDWHFDKHCLPFVTSFISKDVQNILGTLKVTNSFYLQVVNWGDGHAPPPKHVLSKVLDIVLSMDSNTENNILDGLSGYFERYE